jgi:hypothetical protein
MPVHDWTRVKAGIFHDFHTVWIGGIRNALNEGLLPPDYYALTEQTVEPAALARCRSLAIRHVSGHRLVALLEIVSSANKDRARHVEEFTAKAVDALDVGVHVLVVDLFPPGPNDPQGMHGAIRQRLEQSPRSPANGRLAVTPAPCESIRRSCRSGARCGRCGGTSACGG